MIEQALKAARQALTDGQQTPRAPLEIAGIYAFRSDRESALEWLQRGYDAGWRDHIALARDPIFAGLRQDSTFQSLLKRMEADVAGMRRRANVRDVFDLLPVPSNPPK